MNISKIIYNVTGRMTKKHIIKTAESIGTEIIKRAHAKGDLQISDINEIYIKKLGKKKASKIIISDKFEDFKNFAMKHLSFSDEMAEMFFMGSKATVLPNSNLSKTFLKINLKDFDGLNEIANTIAHESEHLLFINFSFRNFFERLGLKIKGSKWANNYIKKYATKINEKNLALQQYLIYGAKVGEAALGGFSKHKRGIDGLLQQMEIPTLKDLQNSLTNIITHLTKGEDRKTKLKILKGIKFSFKDEVRAYRVGSNVERSLYPKTERATKSEILAQLFEETIKVLNGQIKTERKNKLRNLFRLNNNK